MENSKYPFGTPKRVLEQEKAKANPPKPAETWVPASEKGYERNTATGAIRQKSFMADENATCGVVPSVEDVRKALLALHFLPSKEAWRIIDEAAGFAGAYVRHIPADRRADVIAALNKLGA